MSSISAIAINASPNCCAAFSSCLGVTCIDAVISFELFGTRICIASVGWCCLRVGLLLLLARLCRVL